MTNWFNRQQIVKDARLNSTKGAHRDVWVQQLPKRQGFRWTKVQSEVGMYPVIAHFRDGEEVTDGGNS